MTINFYYHWLSPPSRIVYLVIKNLKIDANYKVVDLTKREQKTSEYLKINPTGQVPAIDDNGFHLGESRAIALYLCNKYRPDNDLYPKNPEKRAQVDQMLYFDAATFYPVFIQNFFAKKVFDAEPSKELAADFKEKLSLLNNFIGDKKYIVGNHLTVPDLSLFASVSYLEWMDVKFNEFSHIKNWYHRIQNEHQYVNEIVTKFDKFDELKAYLQNDPRPRIRAFAKAFGKKNN